ncbi:MAG: hypothetical protein K6G79_07850 [Bacteroidales bacterium]|nr:hypothetical protein [Bacteroidales bacterium]
MNTEKLDIMQTIKDGISYGLKNFFPLILMIILYFLTVWIPYLNVGTTIGLYKAVIKIGRGETIDPTSIFNKQNFEGLSGFFLLMGLLYMGIGVACCFLFIPGIVMSIAWTFAIYFFLDKKVSPLKSLQLSYDTTYGNKWRIFGLIILCGVIFAIISALLGVIPKVGVVLVCILSLVFAAIMVAIDGVMYNFFSKKADSILSEPKAPAGEPVNPIDEVTTEA